MAGDWIKMRGALLDHPKVITMTRQLWTDRNFREWLLIDPQHDDIFVSDCALRCVTCALLMRLWSASREHGQFIGDDLVLRHSIIDDLDQMAGAPGVGHAMQSVGWAIAKDGVTLPNFREYNVPMTAAEKQKEYRERLKERVTGALPARVTNVTTRVEKRRIKKSPPNPPQTG